MECRCYTILIKTFIMAAIEKNSGNKNACKRGLNKYSTRVDLTPMVDLGFLLITFFVFTTQLSNPTVMNLIMPNDKVEPGDNICATCVLTLIPGPGNIIQYYEGMPETKPVVKQTSFLPGGIRKIILQKMHMVQQVKGSASDMVLIIKPGQESTFQNFVDIIDEVTINNVKHYYVDEVNDADKKLISQKL